MGWEVHEDEQSAHASVLIPKTCLAEGICEAGLVLHSDNGGPMKGATMLATLQRLGVVPSFSRPPVSDDNRCSEILFRTLKYTPAYPSKPFASLSAAREWVFLCIGTTRNTATAAFGTSHRVRDIVAKMLPLWRPGSGSTKPPNKHGRSAGPVTRGTRPQSMRSG